LINLAMLEALELLDCHYHHHGATMFGDDHRRCPRKINQATEAVLSFLGGQRYHRIPHFGVKFGYFG
jgi:hypothetical protein